MGPSISSEQYNAPLNIKTDYIGDEIGSNSVIAVNEYHMGYWVQYVLGREVVTGNNNETQVNTSNSSVYQIEISENQVKSSHASSEYLWNPLLPYSFPIGFDSNLSNTQQSNGPDGASHPSGNLPANSNGIPVNGSNGPPRMNNSSDTSRLMIMGNGTTNNAAISPPGGFGNTSSAPKNGNNPNYIDGG